MVAAARARIPVAGAVLCLVAVAGVAPAGAQTPVQTLSPSALAFGTVAIGATSAAQRVTFSTNSMETLSAVSVAGPFASTGGTCKGGVVVAAGSSCTVDLVFSPASAGDQSGTVTVAYNRNLTRQSTLTGTGASPTTTTSTTTSTTTTLPTSTTEPGTTTAPRPTSTRPVTTTTTGPGDSVPDTTTTAAETSTSSSTSTTEPRPAPSTAPDRRGITLDATASDGTRAGPPGIGLTVVGTGYPVGGRALGVHEVAAAFRAQAEPACATVYLLMDGQRLGSVHPDASGAIRKHGIAVPGDVPAGRHDLVSSCRASGAPALATSGFVVTEASVHRSAFATALPHVDQVDMTARQLALSALAVAGLLVLIAFPAELFNTTLEDHYDEVRAWFGLKARSLRGGRGHGVLLVVFLLLSGPLWFAMQRGSGLDATTAFGALGLSLATAAVVFTSDLPKSVYVRQRYGERATPIVLPGSLVVAVACVALSRAVHFQPGYFYGLVGGLALSRSLERHESGRLAARTATMLLVLSVGAWAALQPVSAAAARSGRTAGMILVENLLGGIFWVALDTLVIALLPLRLLEGAKIVGWSRTAWAALYGVVLLAFVHILLRPGSGYVSNTTTSPASVVIALFVGFATFSFAFWGYFRFRPGERSEPAAGEPLADEV